MTKHYKLAELAAILDAELQGDPQCVITGIATLSKAQLGQIAFLDNVRYRKYLAETKASAVILASANKELCPCNALILKNPYLGYAKVATLFDQKPRANPGVHPSAVIGSNCQIHPSASVGPFCHVGDGVVLAENVVLGAGCSIGDGSNIGAASVLMARVAIYHAIRIGQRVIIHSGAVIGSDGFGFAQNNGVWQKVPQLGSVIIGNDVEIGANSAIDRGAIEDTILEDGVKIDNLVQIAHNVIIGAHTAIAGCVGIAGSTTIGKHCAIGGGVGIAGHINITDRVIITGGALVAQNIDAPGIYTSGFPAQPTLGWKKIIVRVNQLDMMMQKLRDLEKLIKKEESV